MTHISPHRWRMWLRCQKWAALFNRNTREAGKDGGFEFTPELAWNCQWMTKTDVLP